VPAAGRPPAWSGIFRRRMGLIYAITFAVLTWLVLWALGWKATDATLIASGIILVAVMTNRVFQYLADARKRSEASEA